MKNENFSSIFWQVAGEQRFEILLKLQNGKSRISQIAKELSATTQEVSRNFNHLRSADLVTKDTNNYYDLTTFGKIVLRQTRSLIFISNNKKYFRHHDFDNLPNIFKQSIGSLESGQYIFGFVKVESKWKKIIENAKKYVKNILIEVPTSEDLIKKIVKQANQNVTFYSIFSESAIFPSDERNDLFKKFEIHKWIKKNKIQRRMKNDMKVAVHLNETEALVIFPSIDGETDFSKAFYSKNCDFHDWCLQYFENCWNCSKPFLENKIIN